MARKKDPPASDAGLFGASDRAAHQPTETPAPKKTEAAAREVLDEVKRESPRITRRMALAKPFPASAIKWKAQTVKGNRCLAVAYIDSRLVMDRLDDALGVDGWSDEYQVLDDGSVVCRLTLYLFAAGQESMAITKSDVGSPSEQPDKGDRLKAAFSDALKRAAVKFGVGRYIYRLPHQWVDYDPVKKQITRPPQLPAWAIPKVETPEEKVEYVELDDAAEPVASDATQPHQRPAESPAKGDKLPDRPAPGTPRGPAKEAPKESPKAPAKEPAKSPLEAEKDRWKDLMHDCATADALTKLVKARLRSETPKELLGEVWEYIQQVAGTVRWEWHDGTKQFIDES